VHEAAVQTSACRVSQQRFETTQVDVPRCVQQASYTLQRFHMHAARPQTSRAPGPQLMAEPNYYKVLGVEQDASSTEIKSAYRALALRNHPDVSKRDNAQVAFSQIVKAYSVLSDPIRRAEFDNSLARINPPAPPPRSEAGELIFGFSQGFGSTVGLGFGLGFGFGFGYAFGFFFDLIF